MLTLQLDILLCGTTTKSATSIPSRIQTLFLLPAHLEKAFRRPATVLKTGEGEIPSHISLSIFYFALSTFHSTGLSSAVSFCLQQTPAPPTLRCIDISAAGTTALPTSCASPSWPWGILYSASGRMEQVFSRAVSSPPHRLCLLVGRWDYF